MMQGPMTARSDVMTPPMERQPMQMGGDDARSQRPSGQRPRQAQINRINDVQPVLKQTLDQIQHPLVMKLEEMTGLDRLKLFYIFCAFMAFWLMAGPGNRLVCTLIGFAYPAYQSVLAVRTEEKDDDTQWLIYWCAFAAFSIVDFVAECFTNLLPLYFLLKTIFLLYLALPQTYGAHNIYVNYVDPFVDWLNTKLRQHGVTS